MTWLEALILGIIQGLTEFLPISSSGHLELAKFIFGNTTLPEESLFFTVLLHAATAISTIVIFRKEIGKIFKGLFQFENNEEFQFSLRIVISMFPAAFVGLFFEDIIESLFSGSILLVSFMLLITGLLLLLADKAKTTNKSVGIKDALIIGIAQAIAILPGISRSGATISSAVLLGVDREKSARFSFLMVIPLILGKMAKDILDDPSQIFSDFGIVHLVGFLAAFLTGLIACTWMIALVKKAKLSYFSIYCFIVGSIGIVYSLI